ncbi:hypothetical protein [Alicyclobacillus fodiniaquatilis]|uniref:Uncharacterized protein n=1 Tax=Alicyclobacillus fodiniaquatilis TaxID=1661150 RepID=A0ABW4JIQ3_9BACL
MTQAQVQSPITEDTILFEGRYGSRDNKVNYGQFSFSQIREWLKSRHRGMMHMTEYHINGVAYIGFGGTVCLSIGDDFGVPVLKDGNIVVETQFRRNLLGAPYRNQGHPNDLVKVEAVINPSDPELFITVVQNSL